MNELIQALPQIQLYTTVMIATRHLRPSEYNPRVIKDDNFIALKKSLAANPDFFKARPILVNTAAGREGVIIGGDKRFRAAVESGLEKVPVMFVLAETVEKEKAWNLLDNKNAGDWDQDKLKNVIEDLHAAGYNMDTLGHTPGELVNIMEGFNMSDPTQDQAYKENGTTPGSKVFCCPECGYEGNKKDFKKPTEEA